MPKRKGGLHLVATDDATGEPGHAQIVFPCLIRIPIRTQDGRKGTALVNLTGEDMTIFADDSGLGLTIGGRIVGVDEALATILGGIWDGEAMPGLFRPEGGGGG